MSLSQGSSVPSASEIVEHTPLIYAIDPNPLEDGAITWTRHGNAASKQTRDTEAYTEAERNTNTLLNAEGYINLIHVNRVQNVHRGNSRADETVNEGPDVDFHQEVSDTRREDGKTDSFDDDRTFELKMRNGLTVRLQAYNEE